MDRAQTICAKHIKPGISNCIVRGGCRLVGNWTGGSKRHTLLIP